MNIKPILENLDDTIARLQAELIQLKNKNHELTDSGCGWVCFDLDSGRVVKCGTYGECLEYSTQHCHHRLQVSRNTQAIH